MGTITAYGSKHSHEFKLTVNETSTSTPNNTSDVSFSFTIYKSSYSWSNWNSIKYEIIINGVSYSGTIPSYSAGSTMTIKSGSQTIKHNNDGTKSINYSFSVTDGSGQSYTCGSASASGSMNLTTIPRYATANISLNSKTVNSIKLNYSTDATIDGIWVSKNGGSWESGYALSSPISISGLSPNTKYSLKIRVKRSDNQLYSESNTIEVTTYDIAKLTTVPNVNIGSSHTITWTNPSGATTSLKLCKMNGTQVIDYGTVTGTSKLVIPTASIIYALTPNSNTITLRYIITTTANSKSYTSYKDCVFAVTNSNPTFSNFTYKDINGTITALTGNNQILVKGYSNVQGTISTANKATAKNSATMKTYKMLIGSKSATANYSSNTDVNITLNGVTANVIDMYAIDSRGNSTKVSKTVTMKNYSNVSIDSVTAIRTNNVGSEVALKFEGTFWNDSFGTVKNSIKTCKYQYKQTSSSEYVDGETTLTYTINGNKITGSLIVKGDLGASGFDIANSYNIRVILADQLSSTTYAIILGSGNPAIAVYKNNVAIGQKYNTSDGSKLQVNGDIKAVNVKGKINGNTWDINTENATDTWVPVFSNGKIQHRKISSSLNNRGVKSATSKTHTNFGTNDNYLADMSFLTYWNGAYNSGNTSNLTYCYQGKIQAKPKSLYDNSSGTSGTVTLNESAANFSYLEIFYSNLDNKYFNCTKVFSPNGKQVSLIITYYTTFSQVLSKHINISGTQITNISNGYANIYNGNTETDSTNEIKIFKVIGYK